ncbi:MAG TPA: hypothetical protein PKY14_00175 [Bacteroidales bacterium]|nr:hypothetical protein [Bacteroidales bacterium]HPV15754.1 hypothetical protein [Bacteroidales bacterium]
MTDSATIRYIVPPSAPFFSPDLEISAAVMPIAENETVSNNRSVKRNGTGMNRDNRYPAASRGRQTHKSPVRYFLKFICEIIV